MTWFDGLLQYTVYQDDISLINYTWSSLELKSVLFFETCFVLILTFVVVTGLRVARLVLNPLSLTVLPPVLRHRVSALPVGELHPTSTCSGALLPRSP